VSDWQRCRIDLLTDAEPRVEITDTPPPPPDARVDEIWERKRTANPRLFNGPILAFESADPARGVVRARRDEFKSLTVQPEIDRGVTVLGVTGVLIAKDHAGDQHVFLGRRAHATRVYGGMWELGPSGGVDAPPRSADHLDQIDLFKALRVEMTEELGLPIDVERQSRSIVPIAFVHDPIGMSYEIVIRVELTVRVEELITMGDDPERTSAWEYDATRWVPMHRLAEFDAQETDAIIPPTRALFRGLGWV
jgi:8-oxo-dGTP pyrophosphatase MutT (NUDIX family)